MSFEKLPPLFLGKTPEDASNFEELLSEIFEYLSHYRLEVSYITTTLNQLERNNPFRQWLVKNKIDVLEQNKIHTYVIKDEVFFVAEDRNNNLFYNNKPISREVRTALGLGSSHFIEVIVDRRRTYHYYKIGDELDWLVNHRIFIVNERQINLFDIIHFFEECSDCGHIYNATYNRECPACEAFKIVNSYSTQVQDILAEATTEKEFGIEIEVEGIDDHSRNHFAVNVSKVEKKYLLCKSDGSLRHGVELVTKPASYAEHIQRMPNVLQSIAYKTSRRTGMHVHVNSSLVKDSVLLNLFIDPIFHEVINKMSGRPKNYHINGGYARHNTTLSPNRYFCYHNQTGKGTVEFRMFATPKNTKLFFRHMEFVKSCVDFSNWYNYRKGYENVAKNYLTFIEERESDYPLIAKKFKTHKWFVDVAAVNITDPRVVFADAADNFVRF